MKRRMLVLVLAMGAAILIQAACSPHRDGAADPARTPDGWVSPPQVLSVQRTAEGLTVRGRAAPLSRVVLRGDGDRAYATGADASGRFELKIQTPAADALFVVETQNGQDAAPAPYRLFVTRDPAGPIGLLTPGAPTRRLDGGARAGRLDAVDTDGRALLLSGRARPGAGVALALAGQAPVQIRAGADGIWTARPGGEGPGATVVTVDGAAYAYPGRPESPAGEAEAAFSVRAAPGGWSVVWAMPGGGRQSVWLPEVRP